MSNDLRQDADDFEMAQHVSDEQALIACCLIDGSPPDVPVGAFRVRFHSVIHAVMIDMTGRGEAINFRSVSAQIEKSPGWGKAGATFVDFVDYHELLINPASTKDFLEGLLLDRYMKHEAGRIGLEISHDAVNPSKSPRSIVAKLKDGAERLSSGEKSDAASVEELMQIEKEMYEKDIVADDTLSAKGIPTSLSVLNRHIIGLVPGRLYIIAARPSIGKTSLGHDMSISLARAGIKTLVISLEMTRHEVMARLGSNLTNVSASDWLARRGDMTSETIRRARQIMSTLPILISDIGISTDMHVDALVRKHRPGALIVDYLQLLDSASKQENRNLEIGHITKMHKQIAMTNDIPVVLLSQLSRKGEGRRPILSDLRDSGNIEQDADVVIALHRETTDGRSYDEQDKPIPTEIHVLKNRQGKIGSFPVLFIPTRCAFAGQSMRGDDGVPF